MKYLKITLCLIFLSLSLYSCAKEASIVRTYEETDSSRVESCFDNGEIVTVEKYYELSDGTYRTDSGNTYKYRLEITGRMHSAVRDSTFVYLSNRDDITFDEAWKAAGYSSNLDDYFNPEEAVLVGIG